MTTVGVETTREVASAMIEVKDVRKSYRDRPVLDGISFTVQPGEIAGFLGPNGAGKTTTLRIVTGFLSPTSGSVNVAGFDVVTDPMAAKAAIGYLPERPPLYDEMTVVEYLRFVARMRGLKGAMARERVGEVLALCTLEGAADRLLGELSRGFRQRAAIAQALVADPPVLILDEPTSGLDPVQALRTRELIRKLSTHRTILFSTHILSEVEAVADRVIMLVRGKIAADGPIRTLASEHPPDRYLVRFSREVPEAREVLSSLPDVQEVVNLPPGQGYGTYVITRRGGACGTEPGIGQRLVAAATDRGWPLVEVSESPAGLERLFFSILGEEVRS
jgi:ABC-2 type transport system ATP-binding protein